MSQNSRGPGGYEYFLGLPPNSRSPSASPAREWGGAGSLSEAAAAQAPAPSAGGGGGFYANSEVASAGRAYRVPPTGAAALPPLAPRRGLAAAGGGGGPAAPAPAPAAAAAAVPLPEGAADVAAAAGAAAREPEIAPLIAEGRAVAAVPPAPAPRPGLGMSIRARAWMGAIRGWLAKEAAVPTMLKELQANPATPEGVFRYTPSPQVLALVAAGNAAAEVYNVISYNYQRALYDCLRSFVTLQQVYTVHTVALRKTSAARQNVLFVERQTADVYAAECDFLMKYYILAYLAYEKMLTYRNLAPALLAGGLQRTPSITTAGGGELVRLTARELVGLNAVARTILQDAVNPDGSPIQDEVGDLYACGDSLRDIHLALMSDIPEGGWPRLVTAVGSEAPDGISSTVFDALNAAAGGRYTSVEPTPYQKTDREAIIARMLELAGTTRKVLGSYMGLVWNTAQAAAGVGLAAGVEAARAVGSGAAAAAGAFVSGNTAFGVRRNRVPGGGVMVGETGSVMIDTGLEEIEEGKLQSTVEKLANKWKRSDKSQAWLDRQNKDSGDTLKQTLVAYYTRYTQRRGIVSDDTLALVKEMLESLGLNPGRLDGTGGYGPPRNGAGRGGARRHRRATRRHRHQKKRRATRRR
jgi:hypothetical protein